MFTKSGEYAIRATLMIARNSLDEKRIGLKAIAKAIDSPEAFTAKILQQLSRHDIITSVKGPNGGFFIEKSKLEKYTLLDVLEIVEGKDQYTSCGLGLKECNDKKPCPIHEQYAIVRKGLRDTLKKSSLKTIAMSLESGQSFLKS